ncbi:MAG: short-chain dehydrogenase/reductase [Alphaproteobacteria bacterium]
MALELNLAGKKAVVTGASEGIGRAIAKRLGSEGVHLYLAARSGDNLAAVAAEIRSAHKVDIVALPLDLSKSECQQELAKRAADADILINNAGAIPAGTIHDVDEARWRAAWDLKVFGYINLCRAFYRHMKARGGGVIVNVIGAGGEKPSWDYIAGSTGNSALITFTKALGSNSSGDGIRVLGVNPGPVATERLVTVTKKAAKDTLGDEARYLELWKPFAFGRAATPEEIATTVAFFASDVSSYTSGATLTMDGGLIYKARLF